MVTVIPFRAGGKSRLPRSLRRELALAMLGDVVEAASAVGEVRVVTSDVDGSDTGRGLGAEVVADPGEGQGVAVRAALELVDCPALVVNADLPCVTEASLRLLAASGPALVVAADGTTNALALPDPTRYEPLYGPGSAARFAATGLVPVAIGELAVDVDTLDDLALLELPIGPRTTLVVIHHEPLFANAS